MKKITPTFLVHNTSSLIYETVKLTMCRIPEQQCILRINVYFSGHVLSRETKKMETKEEAPKRLRSKNADSVDENVIQDNRQHEASIMSLNDDVLMHIFSFLPFKSRLRIQRGIDIIFLILL